MNYHDISAQSNGADLRKLTNKSFYAHHLKWLEAAAKFKKRPRWDHPLVVEVIRRLRIRSGKDTYLKSGNYLYHGTRPNCVSGIQEKGLVPEPFYDNLDEDQNRLFRDLSVVWFSDAIEDYDIPLRARLGDLFIHGGRPDDLKQGMDGKHYLFTLETRIAPHVLAKRPFIGPEILEIQTQDQWVPVILSGLIQPRKRRLSL